MESQIISAHFRNTALARVVAVVAIGLSAQITDYAQGAKADVRMSLTNHPPRVALIVNNHAGSALDSKVPAFEGFLASRIAQRHFQVLSRQVVLDALRNFSAGSTSTNDTPGRKVDRVLSDNTSALRLTQNLGADYVLLVSLDSYAKERRVFSGYGIRTTNVNYTLRVTYRVAAAGLSARNVLLGSEEIKDQVTGAEVTGDQIAVSRSMRQTANLQIESDDLLNALLEEAANKLAASLRKREKDLPALVISHDLVRLRIRCRVTDFAALPNVGVNKDNEVVITPENPDVFAMNVAVEVDGTVVGSTPGTFSVASGLHRLRLTRDGFKPFERIINVVKSGQRKAGQDAYDQELVVAMQMTDAGFQRWKDMINAYSQLEAGRKLTRASAEVLRGYAEQLRQSGFRVDAKKMPNVYKSIY